LVSYELNQAPATYQFSSNASLITNYYWNFGDGVTSSEANPLHTFTTNGSYTVQLIGEGPCGSDTSTVQIVVNSANNEELTGKVNIASIGNNSFKISGISNLSKFQIFDLTGRAIAFEKLPQSENETVFKLANAGIFFLTINSGEMTVKLPYTIE
jgi:PKD repeat protein